MRNVRPFKYYRVVLAYTLILMLFLSLVITVINSHHSKMMKELQAGTQRELKLIGNFARDVLVRNDYASFEYFLNRWADEQKEIVQLKATAPNNFILVDFRRESAPVHSFNIAEQVIYEGRELIYLEIVKDMSPAQISMLTLRSRLITGSIFITALLGLVLWFVMRKLALAPMEREIFLKEQVEKKFRMLLESAPDSIVYSDPDGKILMVNGETEKLFGYPRGELEGQNVEILMPTRFRDRHRQLREIFIKSSNTRPMAHNLELYGYTREGMEFPADINLRSITTEDGLFILSSIRDISERKVREEKTKRSYLFQRTISKILLISLEPISLEEQLLRILDAILSIPDLTFQAMGSIYLMNDDLETMSLAAQRGFPESAEPVREVIKASDIMCRAAEDRKIAYVNCAGNTEGESAPCADTSAHKHYCVPIFSGNKNLGSMELIVQQDHRKSPDEEDLLAAVANTIAGIIEHNRTNMERQQLQRELSQAEKMSALGRLTANVAHEIRNPLTLIGGFARKLSRTLYKGEKDIEYSNIIIAQVSRLEKILKNVLTYSREAKLNLAEHDIHEILEEVIITYRNECKNKSIQIQKRYSPLPRIYVDKDQVWIVLNNLFANAVDSMSKGGEFTITTQKISVFEKEYIVASFTDTGQGIPEDQLNTIFEPFFTTKLIGRGTGLGLSISRKIMEDHGGLIKVESDVEKGTTFDLFFPLT